MLARFFHDPTHLLLVRAAGSNELEVSGDGSPVQLAVTHDLLDQTNGVCCICIIKEYHCIQCTLSVYLSFFLSFLNKPCDIRFYDASVHLTVMNQNYILVSCS